MKKSVYEEGFIKLRRNLLSQPEIVTLLAEEGWAGVGLYVGINLYLSHCESGWGAYTSGQLSALAIQGKKHRSDVSRIIGDYGLFVIKGSRFTSLWMQRQCGMDAEKMPSSCATPARSYSLRAEEIEKDKEKEIKEKAGVRVSDDTPPTGGEAVGPSAYETVDREGVRHGKHGETVPWWAPPQTDVYAVWSMVSGRWLPRSDTDAEAERRRRREMAPEDFMMKSAWEQLSENEHHRIQDYARRT